MIPAGRGAVGPALENDKGPTELRRLLDEALRCLESTDLPGANAALKKAYVEATSPVVAAPGDHQTARESEDRG